MSELNELVNKRITLKEKIREITRDKRETEYDIIKILLDSGKYQYLTADWTALERAKL